jgi:hypothetical protein
MFLNPKARWFVENHVPFCTRRDGVTLQVTEAAFIMALKMAKSEPEWARDNVVEGTGKRIP